MIINKVIEILRKRKRWRALNPHNSTICKRITYIDQVIVGKGTYGEINVESFGNEHKVWLGNFISIARNVTFVIDGEHNIDTISTYPFKVKYAGIKTEATSKGDIIVDDDVWIGYCATILSGVHIGQGAVIAAGAVVTSDVPPYAIVGGVPAKVIKYRFSEELISRLLKVDYSKLTNEQIQKHINELYEPLKETSQLAWLPEK